MKLHVLLPVNLLVFVLGMLLAYGLAAGERGGASAADSPVDASRGSGADAPDDTAASARIRALEAEVARLEGLVGRRTARGDAAAGAATAAEGRDGGTGDAGPDAAETGSAPGAADAAAPADAPAPADGSPTEPPPIDPSELARGYRELLDHRQALGDELLRLYQERSPSVDEVTDLNLSFFDELYDLTDDQRKASRALIEKWLVHLEEHDIPAMLATKPFDDVVGTKGHLDGLGDWQKQHLIEVQDLIEDAIEAFLTPSQLDGSGASPDAG